MDKLTNIFLIIPILLVGILLIVGAYKRWKWLIDPPTGDWLWLFYSQAGIKKLLGKTFLLYYTYILGIAFTLISLLAIYQIIVG
jgi:hypothetical protein